METKLTLEDLPEGFCMDDVFGVCPYATVQRLLQGKWSILILHKLETGPLRFNKLQRTMPKMTHATLSKQLKQLEKDKLIIRTEYPQIPPRVEYELSEIGGEFKEVLDCIQKWGYKYIESLDCQSDTT